MITLDEVLQVSIPAFTQYTYKIFELSDNLILVTMVLLAIVVTFTIGRAIYILYLRGQARGYNRFVYDYYGLYGKPTPIMIVRYQNNHISTYNEQCDTLIGRLFCFRKMTIVNGASYEDIVELYRPTLPRDPRIDYQYMQEEMSHSEREIAAAVNFRFDAKAGGNSTKFIKRSIRKRYKN